MSNGASTVFATDYLTGFFDMIATMVSEQASFDLQEVRDAGAGDLPGLAAEGSAVIQATVQGGGALAVLLSARDAYAVAAAFMGQDAKDADTLADEDLEELKEVYDPCLGAGVSVFKEKYDQVIALEDIQVIPGGPGVADTLAAALDDPAVAAEFDYSVPPSIGGSGVLLFSKEFESVVPAEVAAAEAGRPLDQGGVEDILGAVGLQPEAAQPGGAAGSVPANLEMVLDIRLVVKARLGRIEMPIAEILALGPGSIIEVGHMVDEPIELLVNDKLIARGDVVVVDEKFGLRITEIISQKERIESLR